MMIDEIPIDINPEQPEETDDTEPLIEVDKVVEPKKGRGRPKGMVKAKPKPKPKAKPKGIQIVKKVKVIPESDSEEEYMQ